MIPHFDSGSQHSLNSSRGLWVGGRFRAARMLYGPIRSSHFAGTTGTGCRGCAGTGFLLCHSDTGSSPPTKSRAWLPGATRNPQLFILSLLPSGLASTREVRDTDTAGREELVVSPSLFIGRRGLAAARASGKAAGGGEPAEGATGGGRPWSSPEVPCIEGEALVTMPVDDCWLYFPASRGRTFVQTVWVAPTCPNCCWFPGFLPPVPRPPHVPRVLLRGPRGAVLPASRPSKTLPSSSQTPCPTDPCICPPPSTPDSRQEKNTQSELPNKKGQLQKLPTMNGSKDPPGSYDFDLIIIGGGSGGLAAAKEAAKFDKKVLVLDFVTPTPLGTRWGLGGTCVNVGCIPKKLMHQAALLGQALKDSRNYGWKVEDTVKHDWEKMTESVQSHIGSLNWGYRVALREKKVVYENAYGRFIGPHRIVATNNKGKEKIYSAERFLIATGERPRYLGIPGDKEYCISSDDLFSLPYCPGKTLVVGASYVALECAGFLAGIGLDVTVMVRSILLRGFDQDMANKIGEHMEEHGIKFIRQFVPTKIEQIEAGTPGRLRVTAQSTNSEETIEGEFNTVLLAVGRDSCTRTIGLETVGVKINEKTGKIPVTDEEQTNVPYIYAIGDILEGKLELTPVAIQAGRLLAQRLYGGSNVKCDYDNVPTTVFTPLEYGCCGLSEEKAVEKFGEENIEVYHSFFWPLEWTVPSRDNNKCYAKIICNLKDDERVVGFHVLGPNAGEVTQGFAAALKCGLTKQQLDSTIGIHPVCAEIFTTLSVTKRSGGDILQSGC